MSHVEDAIGRAQHEESARVVAALTRHFGDLDGLHRVDTLIRELHDRCCQEPSLNSAVSGPMRGQHIPLHRWLMAK